MNIHCTKETEVKQTAEHVMKTGNPIQYILDAHQSMHVGDKVTALVLLISVAVQSVLNSAGIQPKVSGESGKGKTHCCKAMAHLMPARWILETTLSNKVIYRMGLSPGMVIFSDDVRLSDDLEDTLKRATTNFQQKTYYTTLNKDHEATSLYIPERTVWWLTSVDNNQSLQLLNRQLSSSVDESFAQDQNVLEYQMKQAVTGMVGFPETDEVRVCREIIGSIKEQLFRVIIPFAENIDWPSAENRRNFDMFLDIIMGFAVLRYLQRGTNDTGALIATTEDFESAANLYNSVAGNQQSKTTNSENRLLDALIKLGYKATYEQLCSELSLSQARISHLLNGKEKGHDSGLLYKIPELKVNKIGLRNEIILKMSYKRNSHEVKLKDEGV